MVLRLAKFGDIPVEGLVVLKRKDYDKDLKKSEVNWDDENDKQRQLDRLVKDAPGLVKYIRNQAKDKDSDILSACDLLERVATQDVENN